MYDQPQSIRFIEHPVSRPFTDVTINKRTIPGLMDTSSFQSSIDKTLARFVMNVSLFEQQNVVIPSELRVPIEINGAVCPLKCKVKKLEPGIHLQLAMDFYYFHPFDLNVNGVRINSQKYWNTTHHEEIDFVYNHHRGRFLKRKLTQIRQDDFQTKTRRRF